VATAKSLALGHKQAPAVTFFISPVCDAPDRHSLVLGSSNSGSGSRSYSFFLIYTSIPESLKETKLAQVQDSLSVRANDIISWAFQFF
jgi:hypothetical protein